jgi:thioredoxin-like negative regulator of GroEL
LKKILFSAQWCAPCKALKLWAEASNYTVDQYVDIDEDQSTPHTFRVRGVPTIVITDDSGLEIDRCTGFDINFLNRYREV